MFYIKNILNRCKINKFAITCWQFIKAQRESMNLPDASVGVSSSSLS